MSHYDAPGSKRIKLTQEGELITLLGINYGHSVADWKGKIEEQNITNFCFYIIILISI